MMVVMCIIVMYNIYSGTVTVNKLITKGIESVLFLCTWSVIAAVEANLICGCA